MSEEMSIFNLNVDDFKTEEKSGGGLYKPTPEQGSGGVYTSLIRFLPNPKNPKRSKITKHSHWLEDSEGNGFYFDCPTTIGEECMICKKFFDLRKSDSVVEQERSKNFRRQTSYFHLVQIVEDKHKPELNGKIVPFKMGWKIHEKYQELIEPDFGDPVIPADLFNGKEFLLKIKKVGGWNNYDSCKFMDEKSAIKIDGQEMEPDNKEHAKIIQKYFEDAPTLEKYDFTPWTDEDLKKIRAILSGENIASTASANLQSASIDDVDSAPLDADDSDDSADDLEEFATSQEEEANEDDMSLELDDDDDDWLNDI